MKQRSDATYMRVLLLLAFIFTFQTYGGARVLALVYKVYKTNFTATPKYGLVSEDVYRVSIKINYWC